MGILNVTPDSFSDGGRYLDTRAAVEHWLRLHHQGADMIDVGGESTRPGASRVEPDSERQRIVPVIRALAERAIACSVDTTRAEVAAAVVAAGAVLVNDVSRGKADPQMHATVAALGVPYVLMHWRAPSAVMDRVAEYADATTEVIADLTAKIDRATAAGINRDHIIIDPGIGIAKTGAHNWTLLGQLSSLAALGLPIVVGTSRKRFLGQLSEGSQHNRSDPLERDPATTATTTLAAAAGAWCVRVHDVPSAYDAVRVAAFWLGASEAEPPVPPAPTTHDTRFTAMAQDQSLVEVNTRSKPARHEGIRAAIAPQALR